MATKKKGQKKANKQARKLIKKLCQQHKKGEDQEEKRRRVRLGTPEPSNEIAVNGHYRCRPTKRSRLA